MKKKWICLVLSLMLTLGLCTPVYAAVSEKTLSEAAAQTAAFLQKAVPQPGVGSVAGDWAVFGLARSGANVPEKYYQDYYSAVERYVSGRKGVIHEKKYSEYSRVILALTAIGKDARSVAGYDLTLPLGDYDQVIWQGLNGPIWALVALDSGDYPMPQNPTAKTQATRQMYIDRILSCQLSDGGWSLFGGTPSAKEGDKVSDPDITGMALQALAKYQDQPAVKKATDEALTCMSRRQNDDGGFSTWGTPNCESAVQVLVGLCELGISVDDPRFVKNGNTILDNLMTYRTDENGFHHVHAFPSTDQMATEQGFYGFVAALRAMQGKNSLYRMSDAISVSTGASNAPGTGLAGKDPAVKAVAITNPKATFPDIKSHANRTAIEALAQRGIINGKGNGMFDPDANMTRAEFCAIVVRALGLTPKANGSFSDVSSQWFASYVGTANSFQIVNGVGDRRFAPNATITRQEAAVMVARAAKLCGVREEYDTSAIRDVLAQFDDYVKTADWARSSLALCYDKGILDDSALSIQPTVPIRRCEVAQMLYALLRIANLL